MFNTNKSGGDWMQKLADDARAEAEARTAGIYASLKSDTFSAAARRAMADHRSLFAEAISNRRSIQLHGMTLGSYVRSALSSHIGQTFDADMEAALRELDEAYPMPSNPMVA
jgi:hypothetical protein